MMNRIVLFFTQDYLRKLLALVFAVLLYFGVRGQIFEERSVTGVPVEVKLSPDLSFANGSFHQVMLTVSGSDRALKDINPASLAGSVYVGPEHHVSGDVYMVYMTPDMFKRKPGLKIVNITPLKLNLQRRISKRVQVKVQFSGRLSDEYHRAEVRCIPSEIIVSGPEMIVDPLNYLSTEPIPLSETVIAPFEYESKLVVPADLKTNLQKVMTQVDIVKNFESRRVGGVPIRIMHDNCLKMSASLENPALTAEVILSGVYTRISMLKAEDVRVFADLSNIHAPGIYMVPLRCSIAAEGVSVKAVTPGEVKVKIVKLP